MATPHFPPMLLAELTPAAAEATLVVWLFAMGGAVGSFLNVVVYRLPAAKSIVRPGSHCPACKHPIRWHDNVPILSWFVLRGRCRDCGSKISFRYPLVEAITAALFVVVGIVEGLSGGANLPLEPTIAMDGVVLPPLGIGQSAGIVTYHLLLLCTLLAAALIEYDGHRLPGRLIVPALVVGLVAPLVCPHLYPVAAWSGLRGPTASIVNGLVGLGLGLLLGKIAWQLVGAGVKRLGLWLGLPCLGLFLGWQAAFAVAVVTVVSHWLLAAFRRPWPGLRPVPPTVWLSLSTLGWILAWGWIVGRWPLLG